MTDPWVELIRGGVVPTTETFCTNPSTTNFCEIVDKSWYRGSRSLSLTATEFAYDSNKFLQSNGDLLTDHNPIRVNFTWAMSDSFRQSDFRGGPHGDWFNDLPALPTAPRVASITLRGGDRIDAVSVTLRSGQVFTHGGSGGSADTLTLAAGEFWTKAYVCQGQKSSRTRIFYIQATTSTGRTLTKGKTTGDCGTFQAENGWGIVGFLGQSGEEVDQLAVIYAPQ